MSKRSNIRWKQSDEQELKKAVRNFNDKIRRLEKKNPRKKNALPERVSVKEIKDLVKTRNDLKRELNSLRRFSERGAEELVEVPDNKYNMVMTKWQKKEMSIRLSIINRKRAERYEYVKNIQATSRGEDLGYTVGDIGMKSIDENALKPMNGYFPSMSRKDLNMRFKAMCVETQEHFWDEKELRLKENVMRGITAHYEAMFPEDVEKIKNAIENMSFKDFYKKFIAEQGEMEIVSPPPGQSLDDILNVNIEVLKSTWIPNYNTQIPEEVAKRRKEIRENAELQKKIRMQKAAEKREAVKRAKRGKKLK